MPYINFRSVVAKPKAFNKEFTDNVYLVGDECNLFDTGKIQKRSAFDKNVVYHVNSQEAVFDYIFSHLGVSGEAVNYPVLLTEAFCNPNYSRGMISELMFE
jgi:actin-related protein 5